MKARLHRWVPLALATAACVNEPIAPALDRAPVAAAASQVKSYIVSKGTPLDASFAGAAQGRGDQVIYLHQAAGFAVVRTATPLAYGRLGTDVVADARFDWLPDDPRQELVLPELPGSGVVLDNDRLAALQWGHDAVNSREAWLAGSRGRGVRVAVLDDGIDPTHRDLAPNLNTTLSTSFVPGETYVYDSGVAGDPFSHGAHTSGIIAAADNAFGTIGVAPEAELVMIKVISSKTGSGDFSGIMSGILYAADIGADVINMSLGAYGDAQLDHGFMKVLDDVTKYAEGKGSTLIASAGNDAQDFDANKRLIHLPSDNARVLSIAATAPRRWGIDPTTDLDLLASYSNLGKSTVSFAAPGGDVDTTLLTFDADGNVVSRGPICRVAGVTQYCYVMDMVLSTGSAGGWYWAAGTSMAAPHAAGIAALVIGENGGQMAPAQVKAALRQRATDLGKLGFDAVYGHGRVTSGY